MAFVELGIDRPVACSRTGLAQLRCLAGEAPGPLRHALEAALTPRRRYRSGSEIVPQGGRADECYFVISGWLVLTRLLDNGDRHNIDFAIAGDFIADWSGGGVMSPYAVECVTDVLVAPIARHRLLEIATEHPALFEGIAAYHQDEQNRLLENQANLARRGAQGRLAGLLAQLLGRICGDSAIPRGTVVSLPLTQTQIADALGLTNVHVSRVLSRMRREGVVSFSAGRLEIHDLRTLRAIAAGDSGARGDLADRADDHTMPLPRSDRRPQPYRAWDFQPLAAQG